MCEVSYHCTSLYLLYRLLLNLFCSFKKRLTYITEAEVEKLLNWPAVFEASEQALLSVCQEKTDASQPSAQQPARPVVRMERQAGNKTVQAP